jgi:hypothetical protein
MADIPTTPMTPKISVRRRFQSVYSKIETKGVYWKSRVNSEEFLAQNRRTSRLTVSKYPASVAS